MARKPGTGRRKIDIKKIEKKNSLYTAFTKRRGGLFGKAEKYCNLSGANVAIVTFSPNGKPYAFGNPSPDVVIDRFLNLNIENYSSNSQPQDTATDDHYDSVNHDESSHETKENETCYDLGLGLGVVLNEQSSNDTTTIDQRKEDIFLWEESIEGLELDELETFRASLLELKKNVSNRIQEMRMRDAAVKDYFS